MLEFPNIDPVIFEIGPFAVRWYALAYIAGLFGGWYYVKWLDKKEPILHKEAWDNLVVWALFGVILGGRVGYVLFYNLPYYLEEPAAIIKVWQGGMSFHGGALGVILALYLFAKRYKVPYLKLMDMVVCAVPLGLFFGRIANFINGELYGRHSDAPWAMIFPNSDLLPRHPSQLYEALLEGAVLFIILSLLAIFTKIRQYPGILGGLFLIGYGAARTAIEPFREPDTHLGVFFGYFTMGQLLSVPMILLGLYLIIRGIYARQSHAV